MTFIRFVAAAAIIAGAGGIAQAGPQTPLVVEAPSPRQVWSDRISRELGRNMYYPTMAGMGPIRSDFVQVRFVCGDNGRPDKITMLRRSPNPRLNEAARSAVRRIKSMHPLPDGMTHGQKLQANLIFAEDELALQRQTARLREAERVRRASSREEAAVFALSAGSNSPG